MKNTINILFFILSILPHCLISQNTIVSDLTYQIAKKDSLQSEVLAEQRNFWVRIPDDAKPYEKFPVVYMLDGGEQLKGLATVYDYYWGNYLPRMILVGVSNRQNRNRDLTPSQVEMMGMDTGGAENFTAFIANELIPYIDKKYPTTGYRTLIGHSYAGLFTLHTFINHQDLFDNYIAIDPSMDWDEQTFQKEALEKLETGEYFNKGLFVSLASPLDRSDESIGIEEVMNSTSIHSVLARSTIIFCQTAQSNLSENFRFDWKYYPNDIHGSVPLSSMIDGLRFVFEWYQLKDASAYNNPETSAAELKQMLDQRTKVLFNHFGYSVPPADEELLTMAAGMYSQMGQADKTVLFLEYAAKYYPQSEQSQVNLAEHYLENKNYSDAINYFQKAFDLSGNDQYKKKIKEINSRQ